MDSTFLPLATIFEIFSRGFENLFARLDGPLHLRFILQPTVAGILAVRAGLRDAREGQPVIPWSELFFSAASRRKLVHGIWKDTRNVFLISATLDVIYQIIVHRWVYPVELLFTAVLLAILPYFVLRRTSNRVGHMVFDRYKRG
jgi:hypothetical protein